MSFDFIESVTLELPDVRKQMTSFAESADYRENNKIITEIAAIHAGLTSNYNMYTAEALEASLNSWVAPYPRPIIMNHDEYSEPVGRVMGSTMAQEEDGTRYVLLQAAIIDPTAIEKVSDGRYLTGSVGGSAQSAKCSICGTDWAKENMDNGMPCRHKRGSVYEGKLAYFELGELSFREYSFVNIPADQNSGIRSQVKANAAHNHQDEDSKWTHTVKMYAMDMNRPFISEMTASTSGTNILESFSKKRATAQYMNLKGSFLSVSALDYAEKDGEIGEITEAVNTINNELGQDSDEVILSQLEESRKEKAMPGTEVTTTEEDDILAVSEQLSADLADTGIADAEESNVDEGAEELSESSDEKADTEDSAADDAEDSEEEKEEEEEQLADSSEADEQAESADAASETEAEGQEDDSEVESPSGDEEDEEEAKKADAPEESATEDTVLAELNSTISTLQAENAKLRSALHRMLVERVVDAKIAKGVEESAQRATLVEEHSKRTASSLADALRDLERYPTKTREAEVEVPELERRTGAIGDEANATVAGEDVVETKVVDGYKVAEDIFTDALMGRRKLR